tara:strand:+ start:304 stop:1893 length:1590 start_codon:yes stop_codon:yes gene_type:complete
MKKILLFAISFILLSSCSQQQILTLITKTPKIKHHKPTNFDQLNNYQKDAVYLTELIKQTYPRLSTKITTENYIIESYNLIKKLSKIQNDLDFEIEIQKFIALLKDGHSYMGINYLTIDKRKFNIYLYKEKKDWVIWNIDKSKDSLLIGSKIISINGKKTNEIKQLINKFECGENEFWKLKNFSWKITFPQYLEALGIIKKDENLILSITKNNKTQIIEIDKKEKGAFYKIERKERKFPFTRKQNDGFYYKVNTEQNFAYLQMNTSLDYVSIKSDISNYTNFITKPIALAYLKKDTKNARNFGLTLQALFNEIENNTIENLIIDLRYNTGGDERLGKQLIWYLTDNKSINGFNDYLNVSDYFKTQIKDDYNEYNNLYKKKYNKPIPNGEINITQEFLNQPYFYDITKENSPFLLDKTIPKFKGKVYVLIGTNTFSAGQVLATTIADNNLATLVGKPTGNKPTSQTGASGFKLPNTKKIIMISYTFMERPNKEKNGEDALYPNVEIHHTYEQIINGDDKQFEYIINEIKK